MDSTIIYILVLIGNMTVNVFLAYLYHFRVKIEQKQTQIAEENAEARKCLRNFRKYIGIEEETIKNMSPKELEEFIYNLKHLGEDE